MKNYTTSLDSKNIFGAVIQIIIPLLVGTLMGLVAITEQKPFFWIGTCIAFFLLATFLRGAYLYRCQSYDAKTFYINRGAAGPLTIDLSKIKNIKRLRAYERLVCPSGKQGGMSSFWGYHGSFFWNQELGNYAMYAGNLAKPLLITTYNDDYYVVSSDTDDLYFDLQEAIDALARPSTTKHNAKT